MKYNRVITTHKIEEELFDDEIALINQAVNARRSHLRSIDELNRNGLKPKQRKSCPTPTKRKFKDKSDSDYVLHHITNRRNEAEAAGQHYRFKQYRSYKCSCGYWHHSSRPDHASLESFNVA